MSHEKCIEIASFFKVILSLLAMNGCYPDARLLTALFPWAGRTCCCPEHGEHRDTAVTRGHLGPRPWLGVRVADVTALLMEKR